MKTRMKRLISLITAAALCLSCIPMSVVYASDEIISVAEAVPEDVDAAPEIDDGITISEAEVPEQADAEAEYAETDQALADEELVSATAPVQASKSSQDGEYVGGATTMQSGPANPRRPKTYILDLNERNYPLKTESGWGWRPRSSGKSSEEQRRRVAGFGKRRQDRTA